MTKIIEYTNPVGIMLTSYGIYRYVKYNKDMDGCTKSNIMAGMICGMISGTLMLKSAFSS